jgi:hypothetical protein
LDPRVVSVVKFGWLCSYESYQPEQLVRQAVRAEEAGFAVSGLIDAYRPLVVDLDADYVSIQIASVDPNRVLDLIRTELLPELRLFAKP